MSDLSFDQRAAIGGNVILPALRELKVQTADKLGLQLSDDDLIAATVWAAVSYSVQTTAGPSAIERLRDVLDEIEKSDPFRVRR